MIKSLDLELSNNIQDSMSNIDHTLVINTELLKEIDILNLELERSFSEKFVEASFLTRKLVSFQGNKNQAKFRWFKYKEAFSSTLVEYFFTKYSEKINGTILDPFAGIGTTLFTANSLGIKSDGIELLPICRQVINARNLLEEKFSIKDFQRLEFWKNNKPWNAHNYRKTLNTIRISEGAYPENNLSSIERYLYSIEDESPIVRDILFFILLSILESISFTQKDGQYLRWDSRAKRKNSSGNFQKRIILDFDDAIVERINQILEDTFYHNELRLFPESKNIDNIKLKEGSCIKILPQIQGEYYDAIMTSPPYCNRYDYTRTYALELALLGVNEKEIVNLRQEMLSCTVENREKEIIKSNSDWKKGIEITDNQKLLQTILKFLNQESENNRLNNKGIYRMVKGYFYETACIIAECHRLLKKGSLMFMVNDNVRYAGAQISVDIILSDIAQKLGFDIEAILVIPSSKGNSSQQMGFHGKVPLRKCVYVWRKI